MTSPLVQYKRFHFLIPLLLERGYRAAALSEWVLERMTADRWLYSPYKQVRSEVGWLVFLADRESVQGEQGRAARVDRWSWCRPTG